MNRSLLAALCLVASNAGAQHFDIYPFDQGGKIGVAEYDFDQGAIIERRVFAGAFNTSYSVNDPGFIALATGPALPGRTSLRWDFLPMTVAGHTSNLFYWDGVGAAPRFGAPPAPDYRLSLFGRSGTVGTADGLDTLAPGGVVGLTGDNGSLHDHRFFFLDDNGDGLNTTLPANGYYLIALQLRMTGLETSDPFFMVWRTPGVSAQTQNDVVLPWVEGRVGTLVGGGLPGDYNDDGVVDAADYTVFRDGERNLDTVARVPTVWRDSYGATASSTATALSVPEPSSAAACLAALAGIALRRQTSRTAR